MIALVAVAVEGAHDKLAALPREHAALGRGGDDAAVRGVGRGGRDEDRDGRAEQWHLRKGVEGRRRASKGGWEAMEGLGRSAGRPWKGLEGSSEPSDGT